MYEKSAYPHSLFSSTLWIKSSSDAVAFSHLPLYHPEHQLEPHHVTETYWYSKAQWQTNKLVDVTDYMATKLDALYGYHCQMVLTIDAFIHEARLAGVDETRLAQFNPLEFKPLIDKAMRAYNSKIGEQVGMKYAEAFRYQAVEVPALLREET